MTRASSRWRFNRCSRSRWIRNRPTSATRSSGSRSTTSSSARRPRRSEEHTSELQSHLNLVCRLLLEKKTHKFTIIELAKNRVHFLFNSLVHQSRTQRHFPIFRILQNNPISLTTALKYTTRSNPFHS